MAGQVSPLTNLGIAADVELTKVIDIAAHVGDISRDDVNVSYTSLLIGLLWSDDPTSQWLQAQVPQHTVRLDAICRHRNHPESSRQAIVERVAAGTPYAPRKDSHQRIGPDGPASFATRPATTASSTSSGASRPKRGAMHLPRSLEDTTLRKLPSGRSC
jgi:hypothetical protein